MARSGVSSSMLHRGAIETPLLIGDPVPGRQAEDLKTTRSVRIGPSQPMNECKPPSAATSSSPGRRAR